MKKTIPGIAILIVLIALAIAGGVIPEALGEDITFHRVLPVEQDWVHSDGVPTLTVASDDYTIIFVDGSIVAIPTAEGAQRTVTSCERKTPLSAFTYGQYLFVKYLNTPALHAYLLPSLTPIATENLIISNLTGAGSNLFLSYTTSLGYLEIKVYDLAASAPNPGLPLSETNFFNSQGSFSTQLEPASVKSMAVASSTLYYVDSTSNAVYSMNLVSEQNAALLFNDKGYDAVAATGDYVLAIDVNGGDSRAVNVRTGLDVALPNGTDNEQKITLPTSVSASNGQFFVCDNHSKSVNVFSVRDNGDGEQLTHVRSIAGKGSASNRLNSPSDIFCSNVIYVADTDNNRVLIKDNDSTSIITGVYSPYLLSMLGNDVCVADEDGIKAVVDRHSRIVPLSNLKNLVSLTATSGALFAAVNTGGTGRIYKITFDPASETVEQKLFLELDEEIVELSSNKDGSSLVIFTTETITVYYEDGSLLFDTPLAELGISHNGSNELLLSARVTKQGDLYLLSSKDDAVTLTHATRKPAEFEKVSQMALPETFTGFAILDDGTIFFTERTSHSLFEMRGYLVENETDHIDPPSIYDSAEPLSRETYVHRTTGAGYMYLTPGNYESLIPFEEGEVVLGLVNYAIYVDEVGLYYVLRDGVPGYIDATLLEVIPTGTVPATEYTYVSKNHLDILYKYPIEDLRFALVTLEKHTELVPISTVSGYDNDSWYSVRYNDFVYYIRRADVDIATPPPPAIYYYAKIKAEAIGTTVSVFTLPDPNSNIKGTLTDGTEIKLREPLNPANKYTYVVCGDLEGYVLTSSIIADGLTSAQITGMVLICFAGAASTTIFFISRKLRARREE